MEMTGERRIPATREAVWAALKDPAVVRAAIPGCKSLEKSGAGALRGTAAVRVGPVAAQFAGDLRLLDPDPPRSFRIEGVGQGGAAGFAKGGATVTLEEAGDRSAETTLRYAVQAEIGGRMAQLGTRLIDAAARQMADQFFDRLAVSVTDPTGVNAMVEPVADKLPPKVTPGPAAPPTGMMVFGLPPVFWVGAAIFLFIFVMMFAGYL